MGKKRIIQKTKEELIKEEEALEAAMKKEGKVKSSKRINEGRIYVSSSYNNTLMNLADSKGNMLAWVSAGNIGFKGTKKATPFAASKVAEALVQKAQKIGIQKVQVIVKGVGSGRDSAIRTLSNRGLDILSIEDVTPIPHNGCRAKKPRRV